MAGILGFLFPPRRNRVKAGQASPPSASSCSQPAATAASQAQQQQPRPPGQLSTKVHSEGSRESGSPAPSHPQAVASCIVCLESCSVSDAMSAAPLPPWAQHSGSGGSGNTVALAQQQPTCSHYACRRCVQIHAHVKIRDRRYPVNCPSYNCPNAFPVHTLAPLLDRHDRKLLEELEHEHAIPPSERLYCPYKDCSALQRKPAAGAPDGSWTCPKCTRAFCPKCGVAGWHQGYTCRQFQALPAHQRSSEDAAMLKLADSRQWKACPACGWVIERTLGCNHMKCRCGAWFCYRCRQRYTSTPCCACDAWS